MSAVLGCPDQPEAAVNGGDEHVCSLQDGRVGDAAQRKAVRGPAADEQRVDHLPDPLREGGQFLEGRAPAAFIRRARRADSLRGLTAGFGFWPRGPARIEPGKCSMQLPWRQPHSFQSVRYN